MKVVLLDTVLWGALVLCQPEFLGVKVYIGAKDFEVLPLCESNWRDYNCLQSYKMNEKFILSLIFSSVKVSGKTLHSFQCGVSFNRTKIIVKKVQVAVATEASSFKKCRMDNRRAIFVRNAYHYFCSSLKNTQETTVKSYLNSFTVAECCNLPLINWTELSLN